MNVHHIGLVDAENVFVALVAWVTMAKMCSTNFPMRIKSKPSKKNQYTYCNQCHARLCPLVIIIGFEVISGIGYN